MKTGIHLFAFYLLALSLMPCSDGGGGALDALKHLLQIEHQEHASHEGHSRDCGADDCPPFCICTCCASALDFPVQVPLLIEKTLLPSTDMPFFTAKILTRPYLNAIWEPPQWS